MLIAKIITKQEPLFLEVKAYGRVLFDPRPGWLLMATKPGDRVPRQEISWVHPDDTFVEWIRPFNFTTLHLSAGNNHE